MAKGIIIPPGGVNLTSVEMKLLWENASPTSSFAAQTVSLDLSDYDMVLIQAATGYSGQESTGRFVSIASVGTTKNRMSSVGASSKAGYFVAAAARDYAVNSNGMVFDDGKYGYVANCETPDNTKSIPLKIYGIKNIQPI